MYLSNSAGAAQALPPALPKTPDYVIENRKALLAHNCSEHLQVMRVRGNFGTVTNGRALLRFPMPIPDGLYAYASDGTVKWMTPGWLRYPDIELVEPPIQKMRPFCAIPQAHLGHLIPWVQKAREPKDGREVAATVMIAKDGMYLAQWPEYNLRYPFNVPDEIEVSATLLLIALKEMMLYDSIYLSREEHRLDRVTPLVLGRNWGECALILPANASWRNAWGWG